MNKETQGSRGTVPHLISDEIEGIQVELAKYYKHK